MTGARLSIRHQVDSLGIDLATLQDFVTRESPHVRGVALAVAHAVLVLAVSPAVDGEECFVRENILADAGAALERAGLGHIGALVAAAMPFNVLASTIAPGLDWPQ